MPFDQAQQLYLTGAVAAFLIFGISLAFVSNWSRGGK